MRWEWLLVPIVFFYITSAWAGEALSPYTGQEKREIRALSKEEVHGYFQETVWASRKRQS